MKVVIVITTYEWPEALYAVLNSLKSQRKYPEEVLIADDGSSSITRNLILDFQKELQIPVRHFWQEDNGFRKSTILNKTIASTDADYIIQIDGDCILHPYFIEDHLSLAKKKTFLYGSRVNIKPQAVKKVLLKNDFAFNWNSNDIRNKSRNLRIPFLQKLFQSKNKFSEKTRGCNLSYWREDFLAVNGYDEAIEGWGLEDSEFVLRMINFGISGRRLRYGGIVYHIPHKEKSRASVERNLGIQKRTIVEKRVWCSDGVDKYLKKNKEDN